MYSASSSTTVVILVTMVIWSSLYMVKGDTKFQNYIIESETLPEVRFRPPIGNGHVATNVLSDAVYMNGLYNGLEDRSSRARLPAFVAIDIDSGNQHSIHRRYILDLYNGTFSQKFTTSKANVDITYLAHRIHTRLLITRISIKRNTDLKVANDVIFDVISNQGAKSTDFEWNHDVDFTGLRQPTRYLTGRVKEPEVNGMHAQRVHIYYTKIPKQIKLDSDQSETIFTYIASYSMQNDDALKSYRAGLEELETDTLLESHKQGWSDLWSEGKIDIHGNQELSTNIAAATYNILCSLPGQDDHVTPFYGLGPGGLSRGGLLVPEKPGGPRNDYTGHVFWDMDTWILPPIMMIHPGMARRMIGARIRVMDQARVNARDDGFDGIKFPWEQGLTGIEVTPKWAGNMSLYQIHVTADVSYALRQYMYAVDDVTVLTEGRGFELALEIARFWQSRVTHTDDNTVEILGVMGPDEYHPNIDNSVFTNYNAKLSLLLPQYLSEKYSINVNDSIQEEFKKFSDTAEKILILFDESKRFHPQYEGFDITAMIKQSDVVLLGYPLMMNMSRDVRRNDLELYEKITNPHGPDTGTWSMHTVGWLELGDEKRAEDNFKMMFRNINNPFKVFSEKPVTNASYGGCVNFITGAGGLLQSIVFGYGGLRLHPDRLDLNPSLLPNTTSWSFSGLHYHKAIFDVIITPDHVTITSIHQPDDKYVSIETGQQQRKLPVNQSIKFKHGVISLKISPTTENQASCERRIEYSGGLVLCLLILSRFVSLA
ncbi:hypothetical protein ACF0H5_023655 [Mactra antiquata]